MDNVGEDFPRQRHIKIGSSSYIVRLSPTLYGSLSINESSVYGLSLARNTQINASFIYQFVAQL